MKMERTSFFECEQMLNVRYKIIIFKVLSPQNLSIFKNTQFMAAVKKLMKHNIHIIECVAIYNNY